MRVLRFSILLLFLIPVGNTYSQDAKCHHSTEGKDFWFGFMEGRNNNGNVHYIEVTVTAGKPPILLYISENQPLHIT